MSTTPPNPHMAGTYDEAAPEESLLLRLSLVLLRRRRLIGRAALACGLIAAALALLHSRVFTSSASFMPQGGGSRSSLAGLAAQFGVAVPMGTEVAQTPTFYADLLRSRSVLQQVVQSLYDVPEGGGIVRRDLVAQVRVTGDSATRVERAIDALRANIRTSISSSGVVRVDVRATSPTLAQQINAKLLDAITRFNVERRQSQAAAERRFAERRLAEIGDSLRDAEYALATFHQQNRGLGGSPMLRLQEDRLQRRVVMQQQIYTTIAQSYEQSKIEEVRDTPVLTIVELPATPVRPDARGTLVRTLLGLMLGAVVGVVIAVALESVAQLQMRQTGTYEELLELRRDFLKDLARPWRLLARDSRRSE